VSQKVPYDLYRIDNQQLTCLPSNIYVEFITEINKMYVSNERWLPVLLTADRRPVLIDVLCRENTSLSGKMLKFSRQETKLTAEFSVSQLKYIELYKDTRQDTYNIDQTKAKMPTERYFSVRADRHIEFPLSVSRSACEQNSHLLRPTSKLFRRVNRRMRAAEVQLAAKYPS